MEEKKKGSWMIQLIVFGIILAVAAVVIFRLIKWNNSTVELEEVEAGSFDYESMDVVFPMVIEDNREDDGINKMLVISNHFFDIEADGVCMGDYLEDLPDTEVTVLNCYESRVGDIQNAFNNNDVSYWQASNVYDVCYALCNNDFSLQKAAMDNNAYITKDYYDKLTSVDMMEIDTVLICYTSVDYTMAVGLYNPSDPYDTVFYESALRASIKLLQETYPHLHIIIGSPFMHGVVYGDDAVTTPATKVSYGSGYLTEYVARAYSVAMECCVSFDDNFYNVITEDTFWELCPTGILTKEGIQVIGEHLHEYLQRKY